jgi:methylenetetrahydrofolate reductase (NADPH)
LAAAPKGEAINKGIEIAGRMIATIKKESLCHGVHVMAIGKEEVVPGILEAAGLAD